MLASIETHTRRWLLLLLSFAGLVYLACLSTRVGAGDDNQYLMLGTALAKGQGYRMIGFPDAPVEKTIPPGYPMLMASVLYVVGGVESGILPLRMLTVFFAVGFVWATWRLLRPHAPPAVALGIAALTAVSPYTVEAAGLITADMGYAFVSLSGLIALERLERLERRGGPEPSAATLAVVVLVCAAAYLIRTIGIALVAAVMLYLALQRDYRTVWRIGLGFLVLALPWNVWILLEDGDTYLHQLFLSNVDLPVLGYTSLGGFVLRFVGNAGFYLSYLIPGGLVPPLVSQRLIAFFDAAHLAPVLPVLRSGLSMLIIWGVYVEVSARPALRNLYLIVYAFIVFCWPWAYWRYALPILPLVWWYAYRGFVDISARVREDGVYRRFAQVAPVALTVCALAGSLVRDADYIAEAHAYRNGQWPPGERALHDAFRWIRENTHPQSVLMGINVPQFYVFTGRQGVRPPFIPTPPVVLETMIRYDVDYLISASYGGYRTEDLNALFVQPLLAFYSDLFTPVYRTPERPGVAIYAVEKLALERLALGP